MRQPEMYLNDVGLSRLNNAWGRRADNAFLRLIVWVRNLYRSSIEGFHLISAIYK